MTWSRPQILLAVLRAGGMTAASRSLGVAPGTVRRAIDALEASHGGPLLARGLRRMEPTPTGWRLGQIAERLERLADSASPRDSATLEGAVRVTATEIFAVEVLAPFLAGMRALHPRLTLSLGASDQAEDLLRGEADIAVRTFQPTQRALVARRVGGDHLGLYAHRDFLAAAGVPRNAEDLRRFAVIGPSTDTPALRGLRQAGLPLTRKDLAFRCDSLIGQLSAIEAGLGIGATLGVVAGRRPALVRVLPAISHPTQTWVVTHEDQRDSRCVRVVFDALVAFFPIVPVQSTSPTASGRST